ncbi:MAG: 3-oxoacyl-ACP synthase, partial [Spirochaetaceae bacterium]|nr:3-oxoacyl-ACP synthase [Spirochaetaceae bacterium]
MSVMIRSTGAHIPPRRISNEELVGIVDTTDEWIRSHTGIGARHLAADGSLTSDLAADAGR